METIVVLDPLAELRVAYELHNRDGSHESWLRCTAAIDEYVRAGAWMLGDLQREVEDRGSVAVQAAQVIGRMGVKGWPTLKALLAHSNPLVRYSAIVGGAYELWREPQRDEAVLLECAEILADILEHDIPVNRAGVVRITPQFVNIACVRPLLHGVQMLTWDDNAVGKSARCTLIAWVEQGVLNSFGEDSRQALILRSEYERAKIFEARWPTGLPVIVDVK